MPHTASPGVFRIKRRSFIVALAAASALPRRLRAQQERPVIGFLSAASPDIFPDVYVAFRAGLKDEGYVDGENLQIDYRWAENRYERLPALAADLVAQRVAVIAAPGSAAAPLAVKAATSTDPIVFAIGTDPVGLGLVASLNRPGGNATGISYRFTAMIAKRFELLHDVVPKVAVVALLQEKSSPTLAPETEAAETATRVLGQALVVLPIGGENDLAPAFAALVERKAEAVVIGGGPVVNALAAPIAALAARYALPTIGNLAGFAHAGGLVGFGPNLAAGFRQAGTYTGRILKGEKPADMPVEQADTFELAVNLKTAKALGIAVPQSVLVRADELIE